MLKGRDGTEGITSQRLLLLLKHLQHLVKQAHIKKDPLSRPFRIDSVLCHLGTKIKQGDFFFKYIDGNTMNTFVFLLLTTFFWHKLYNTGSHYSSNELILFTLTRISNLYMAGENVEAKNFEQPCLRSITDFGDN